MIANLEHYRIFYHVAAAGSITAAANVLCVSQPAVSQTMRQLEESLGVKLVVRAKKGIRLTAEGQALFEYVKNGYETIQQGETMLKKMMNLEQGEIHIGASDMTLRFYLLPFLEKFHEKYPKIKVKVTNGPTPETLRALNEGKIDFCVVSGPLEENAQLLIRKVKGIRDVFVAGSRFLSLKDKKLPWKLLEELPLICLEKNTSSSRRYLDKQMEAAGVHIRPEFELATSDMIVQFAMRNLGIGVVVESFAANSLKNGELFELTFESQIPERYLYVVCEKKNPLSKAATCLLEMLNEV